MSEHNIDDRLYKYTLPRQDFERIFQLLKVLDIDIWKFVYQLKQIDNDLVLVWGIDTKIEEILKSMDIIYHKKEVKKK